MGKSQLTSDQLKDGSGVNRDDLDITTSGKSVIAKLIAAGDLSLSSTGADNGTGDVTVTDVSYASITSSGGSTTLTASSAAVQIVTGSTTQTINLPVVSTLVLGKKFIVINSNSAGDVIILSSGGNDVIGLQPGTWAILICVAITGTSQTSWDAKQSGIVAAYGKRLTLSNSLTLAGTDNSTLNFGGGGTLGTAAYTAATAYVAAAKMVLKVKPSTTTRTSTTTFADDPDLIIAVLNGETWNFQFSIRARVNGASSGIKFAFAFPTIAWANNRAGLTGAWYDYGTGNFLLYSQPYLNTSGLSMGARDGGTTDILICGATTVKFSASGNFSFQWAQNTSSATGTDVYDGSSLIGIKQ